MCRFFTCQDFYYSRSSKQEPRFELASSNAVEACGTVADHLANTLIYMRLTSQLSHAPGVLGLIGNTPLFESGHLLGETPGRLFLKLEAWNPGGSAKDRPAARMIETALSEGKINEMTTIVESTSGNMGIGLAQACCVRRLTLVCYVDRFALPANVAAMRALGAEVRQIPDPDNGDYLGARLRAVRKFVSEQKNAFWPNQYANPENPNAHRFGTASEIDEILGDDLDYLFVATSSTGTASGCADFFQEKGRKTKVIAVDAVGSVLFGGQAAPRLIPGLGASVEPKLAEGRTFHQVERVNEIDCVVGCRRTARLEGLLVGASGGGVLEAIYRRRADLAGKTCAAIIHDNGKQYLQTVFNDTWISEKLNVTAAGLKSRIHGEDEMR